MNVMRNGVVAVLIAVGVSVLVFTWADSAPSGAGIPVPGATDAAVSDASRISPFGDIPWSNGNANPRPASNTGWWFGPSGPMSNEEASPLSTMEPPKFSVDLHGHLTLNAQTHANMERLLLSGTAQAVQAQLREVSRDLPDIAARELRDLLSKFQKYTTALSQSLPPGIAVATETEAMKQLEQLHNLRASYFGEETAQALFGEEEAMSRHMLAMSQLERDPNLTLQQKAERAQEALSKLPKAPQRP